MKISLEQVQHVKAWQSFSQTPAALDAPVTALLVATHNLVTESVDSQFLREKEFYSPSCVLKSLKSSIFAGDADVQALTISPEDYTGVPTVASSRDAAVCQ